jgi:hypothetical protein
MPLWIGNYPADVIRKIRADRDHRICGIDRAILELLENVVNDLRIGVIEICELLRQTRMHVVDEFEAKNRLQETANEYSFLVRVNHVVAMPNEQTNRPRCDEDVKEEFEH